MAISGAYRVYVCQNQQDGGQRVTMQVSFLYVSDVPAMNSIAMVQESEILPNSLPNLVSINYR